jgi:acetaldehyde dehydrogenase (acetylating)
MISIQDDIIQGQKWISTMVEKLLMYIESLRIVQRPQFESKGHEEINDAKLGSFDGTMGVVRHYIW